MLNLTMAFVTLTAGIVPSGPPLTLKDRANAARECAEVFLERLKEHSDEPLKPKITDVRETHATQRMQGVTAEATLIASKKLGVRMTMNVVGDVMAIQTAHFGVPFHKEEAHPTRDKSLDVLESCLTALLASSNHAEKERQKIMEEWRTHRPALMQIGKRHEVTVDDVKYIFHSLPGSVHVSFILNAKANKSPY